MQPAHQTTAELIEMHPVGQPAEGVPLQGRYEGYYPAQPGVTTAVQYTTVNIPAEPPKDYIVWSICNLVYSNPCCLGLAALIYSIKVRDRKLAGDLIGARNYASTARCLNILATVLATILIITFFALMIVVIIRVQYDYYYYYYSRNSYNSHNSYDYRYRG